MLKKAINFFETNKNLFLSDKDSFLKTLFKSELNPVYILALNLNSNIFNSYFCENINLFSEILDYIYSKNRAYVISDMLELSNINENSSFFINSYLASKNPVIYSKELDFVNNRLKDVLFYIELKNYDERDFKFINELLFYQGESNYIFKAVKPDISVNEEKLRAVFSACCIAALHSRTAFNFVRIATMIFPDIVFPAIYNLCGDNISNVFIFIEKYKFHKKELYNWIVKTPYYYKKVDMQALYNLNKDLFANAAQKCSPDDEVKLHISTKINNAEKLMSLYTSCSVDTRIEILDYVFNLNPAINYIYVCRCIDDKSKHVLEKIISLLKPYKPSHKACIELLNNSRLQIRETSIKILMDDKDSYVLEALISALKLEKNSNLKLMLAAITGASIDKAIDTIDFVKYCSKTARNGQKLPKILWLNLDTLPPVHYLDGSLLEDEVYRYILIAYATEKFSEDNILENIISRINIKDFYILCIELLKRWREKDTDNKYKWILTFVCIYGNLEAMGMLEQYIYNWLYQTRRSIASKAICTMQLSPLEETKSIIAQIEKNIKGKKIKELADETTKLKGFK